MGEDRLESTDVALLTVTAAEDVRKLEGSADNWDEGLGNVNGGIVDLEWGKLDKELDFLWIRRGG